MGNDLLPYYISTRLLVNFRLSVLDEDAFGFDFIGETRVELHKLRNNHLKHFSVFLESHHPVIQDYCISHIIIVYNII